MPIRYVRDGLRVVRAEAPRVRPADDLPPPLPLLPEAERERRRRLRAFNEAMLTGVRRAKAIAHFQQDRTATSRHKTEPASPVPGEVLKAARSVAGLTQRQLARELGYARSVIADAERGVRPVPESVGAWAVRIVKEGGGWET